MPPRKPSATAAAAAKKASATAASSPSPTPSLSRSPAPRYGGGGSIVSGNSRGTSLSPAFTGFLLSVEELQQTPDNRLLSYLMEVYNSVRVISIRPLLSAIPSPSLAVATAAVGLTGSRHRHHHSHSTNPFTPAYVEELLTPRLLCSTIPDVAQLVACLLCDAVRLHHQQQQQQQQQQAAAGTDASFADSPSSGSGGTVAPQSQRSVLESQQKIEEDVAAGVAPLPFAATRCGEVLRCVTRVFSDILPSSTSPSSSSSPLPLKRVAYLIERAAVSHVFRYLLPHCALNSDATQKSLQFLFEAVRCAPSTSLPHASGTVESGVNSSAGAPTSAATCNEMAQVLTDVLLATRDITAGQLTPLLEELAAAATTSAAVQRSSVKCTSSVAPRPPQLQGGALIAARVLLEQNDLVLQPAIAAWATGEVEEGVAELVAADLAPDGEGRPNENEGAEAEVEENELDGGEEGGQLHRCGEPRGSLSLKISDDYHSRRRQALRQVAHVLEVLVALTSLNVDLVAQVVLVLAPHLDHPSADLRLLLVRGFGAIFAAHDAAVPTYAAAFNGPFLTRFLDVKPNIRIEALRTSAHLLAQCAVRSSHSSNAHFTEEALSSEECAHCVAQQQQLWSSFQPCWSRLLADPHVHVRRQAVASVTEAALAAPLLLQLHAPPRRVAAGAENQSSPTNSSAAAAAVSAFLAQTLGLRTRDKNKRVRDAAVEGLTQLYHAYRLAWIPNAVLDAARVESGGAAATMLDNAVEALLPPPTHAVLSANSRGSTVTASGRQATLTRWVGSAAVTSAATPAPRSSGSDLLLFDFEREGYHTGTVKTEGGTDEGDALLGFSPTSAQLPAPHSEDASSLLPERRGSKADAAADTYVDGLLNLCRCLDTNHFAQLLRQAEAKPQLRLAVRRLFDFHAAVKASNGDVKSADGQQRIHAIHRLLAFLQDTTGAARGEWDALFRAKDDAVRKALLRACDPTQTDWVEARAVLLRTLQGRVSANEFTYVRTALAPQMFLPARPDHVHAILRRLRRCIYTSDRAEVVMVDTSEAVAALRALLLLTAASPSYWTFSTAALAEALQAAAKQSTGPPPVWCALLLRALQQWATAAAAAAAQGDATTKQTDDGAAVVPPMQREAMLTALKAMALAALPMQQATSKVATNAFSSTSSVSPSLAQKQLAKQATRTLLALLPVRGFEEKAAASVQSLLVELTRQLGEGRALTTDVKTVAWLASVQALAGHPRAAAALASASTPTTAEAPHPLLTALRSLLLAAIADTSDRAEHARLPKLPSASMTASAATAVGSEAAVSVALPAHTAQPQQQALTKTISIAAAVVDNAAKAMTRIALSRPLAGGARAAVVSFVLEALLQGYKVTTSLSLGRVGAASIASCQRRLAIEKQLVKLLATPTPDLAKELAASVVLSVEDDGEVRAVVQHKLAALLTQRSCDMRVAALLLLTAVSADTKHAYAALRGVVETVGDHLRSRQASQGVSLSSPAALYCYWEYAIPFVVLFLAHHPYYASEEAEGQFVSFQRVWHLLIGELLRHGTQCAGFVVELLSKMKQSDDALDPASNATRVMCDLGSRVLLECLGQRQSRAEDLRRYPGAILLPSFFVPTTHGTPQALLETVFLSESVRVAPNAPFRVPPAAGHSTGATAGRSRSGSRAAFSRAVSPATHSEPVMSEEREENEAGQEDEGMAAAAASPAHLNTTATPCGMMPLDAARTSPLAVQQRTPPTQRKRNRASHALWVAAADDSPSVSLSPSATPHDDADATPPAPSTSISVSRRARTEPALADSAGTATLSESASSASHTTSSFGVAAAAVEEEVASEKRAAVRRAAVDGVLTELFTGLNKTDIEQLRWKVVRGRLEEALHVVEGAGAEAYLEAMLQYAKEQLRVWYSRAPAGSA